MELTNILKIELIGLFIGLKKVLKERKELRVIFRCCILLFGGMALVWFFEWGRYCVVFLDVLSLRFVRFYMKRE